MSTEWLDVADITPRIAYTATASQTSFAIPFVFFGNSDLVVYQNGTVLTLGVDYSVTGAEEASGTLTLGTGATVGDEIVISRHTPLAQTTHIPPSGPLDVPAINIQFSKFVAMIQEVDDLTGRALHYPDSDPGLSAEIPADEDRANKILGFDSIGEPIAVLGPSFVSDNFVGAALVESKAVAQITTFPGTTNYLVIGGTTVAGDAVLTSYIRGTGTGAFTDGGAVSWKPTADVSTDSVVLSTKTVATALAFPAHVLYLIVGGTTTVGDGGATTYKRGTGSGSFTDAGGTVWVPIVASASSGINSLPTLPMLARPKVALFGDSTMMQNNVSSVIITAGVYPNAYPRNLHRGAKGFASWAAAYSLGRWTWNVRYDPGEGDSGKFFSGDNAAFAGEDTGTILLRLPRALRLLQPQIGIFACAINDLFAGAPASIVDTILARFTQMAALCLASGCIPVFTSLPGRAPPGGTYPIDITLAGLPDPGWAAGDARYTYRTQINAGLQALADNSSGTIFFADFEDIYVDPATGYWRAKATDDGVHPSQRVNKQAGKRLADNVLNSMISPLPTQFSYDINVSSFNYLTAGCDPTFNTTGGTAGLGCTTGSGTIGQGWSLGLLQAGSCTVAASIVTPPGGVSYKTQRLVFSISGSNIYERFSLRALVGRPKEPAGTRFKLKAFITFTASAGLCSVTPYIDRVDITEFATEVATPTLGQFITEHNEGMHNTSPKDFQLDGLAETTGYWAETEAVEMEDLTQNFACGIQFDVTNYYGAGGTVSVDVSQVRLYAVRDDRTSYTA